MNGPVATVCVVLAAAVLGQWSGTRPATDAARQAASRQAVQAAARPETISVERQLRLKRRLLMEQESLVAVLRSNRQSWDRCTPEQRQLLRQRAYAFRQADPAQREAVLGAWERFLALSDGQKDRYRQRALWLTAVIGELPQSARDELIKLPPAERARRLLDLKVQMEAQGKLPTTQAAQ